MNPLYRWSHRIAPLVVAVVALTAAGCGNDTGVVKPKTALRGKFLLSTGKKPLLTGKVGAYQGGKSVAETSVNPDGSFEFINIPAGDYQLTVTGTETDTPYGKGVRLNSKYSDAAKSGLVVSVAGDDSPREFTLDVGS